MARPLRLEFPGALYHVTSRGDRREDIFDDDDDRLLFYDVLKEVYERYNWRIHAYCLMSNHYHLLVETPDANLSKGMRHLNGVYTQRFNSNQNRVGHVFQGRYKAILVQKDSYLLELSRYIVLNPVRAMMVRAAKDWPWSSYRATTGQTEMPKWLYVDWLLSVFSKQRATAIRHYKQFVADGRGQPSPWEHLKNQVYLGNAQFVKRMQTRLDVKTDLSEIPVAQKRAVAKPLSYYIGRYKDRDSAIIKAYSSGAYSMKEIGDYVGLHYSWVSRVIRKAKDTS
jgi:REP element-mobilizing transposase RayT